jgi:hypothetical protein
MTGHINVMLVLQSCTDPLQVLPGSSSETFPTSSDGTYDISNIKVEEDEDVIEENFIAINKEADIGIKQEEIPEDITFPDIKAEPDEVSYVCICLLLDTFYQCPEMSLFYVSISGQLKHLHFWE